MDLYQEFLVRDFQEYQAQWVQALQEQDQVVFPEEPWLAVHQEEELAAPWEDRENLLMFPLLFISTI